MTVTLSNGSTINIAKGLSEGSVTVDAPKNSVYVDATNVSTSITATTAGLREGQRQLGSGRDLGHRLPSTPAP
ncbi:hypothetical protein CSV86_026450 [Pseudomonas putida CSV86]|uniref:LapA adhesin domain-containing protein n=1 Tax=Pseudomonas bharatica CSV86 TaxID=1005395 RepID=A0A7K4ELI0_9PSED|nr:immunoglobulin-like domain-containing protein [Pseudomonas bharatica]NNJ18465.1 hypothetical protein [Pseudomonas bharatica CSV86]